MKRAGYRTAAYTGGGNVSTGLGFDAGFDSYHGYWQQDLIRNQELADVMRGILQERGIQ